MKKIRRKVNPIGVYESNDDNQGIQIEPIVPSLANKENTPYKFGGKLFGHKPSAEDYHGSIQICGHARMAVTAAHCVIDGTKAQWYENIIFKKKYPNDDTTFKILAIGVKEKWKNLDYRYDYAVVLLDQNNEDALPFSLKASNVTVTSMGYPSNYHGGDEMMSVTAPIQLQGEGKLALMLGNPFSFGASGGAWIHNDKVIGVNSAKDRYQPIIMSPIFDEEFQSLFDFMKEHL